MISVICVDGQSPVTFHLLGDLFFSFSIVLCLFSFVTLVYIFTYEK
uniref:Uncharacterized protein n=1 Tax=Rhizophora mucronata TaxID=61149 RepID=A0A2P2PJH2_RHIMU